MEKKIILFLTAVILILVAAVIVQSRQTGYIKLETLGFDAHMNLRSGWWNKVLVQSSDEPVKVRVGTYRPTYAEITAKMDGNKWTIDAHGGPWGKLSTIKVEKDQTTVLKPGPTFMVEADVRSRTNRISIGFSIIGQAGEHYEMVTKDGRRIPAPRLKIVDQAGTILASAKFEYG